MASSRRPVRGMGIAVGVWLAVVICWAMSAGAQTTRPAIGGVPMGFAVRGGGERLWVALSYGPLTADVLDRGRTEVYVRRPGGGWERAAGISGQATTIAPWGERVAVAVDAGRSWRVVYAGGSSAGVPVPDGAAVVAMAGGGDGALYVAGRAATGKVLAGKLVLYRLTGGTWQTVGVVPAEIDRAGGAVVGMGWTELGLFVAGMRTDGVLGVFRLVAPELRWEPAGEIEGAGAVEVIDVLALGRRVGVRAGTATGGRLYVDGPPFLSGKSAALGGAGARVTVWAERVREVYRDDSGRLSERAYDGGGQAVGEAAALGLPPVVSPAERLSQVVRVALLVALGAAVLGAIRRRGETERALGTALALPLARRARRLAAGVIDAAPVVLGVPVLAYVLVGDRVGGPDDMALLMAQPKFVYYSLILVAAVVTHTLICELIFGRTLGKWLFGMRVVTLSGGRPSPGATAVRNLLRVVDLMMPVTLFSVLINPLRQTIGDAAAGTVVIEEPRGGGQGMS